MFKRVTIQINNLEIVRVLQENLMTDSSVTILKRIRRIMRTEIKYILREFNQIAKCLTKLSLMRKSNLQVYGGISDEVLELIQQDKVNILLFNLILCMFSCF